MVLIFTFSVNENNETVFARNKSQFEAGGINIHEFENWLAEKSTPKQFSELLLKGAKCLCEARKVVDPSLFMSGKLFVDVELSGPSATNVVQYSESAIYIQRTGAKFLENKRFLNNPFKQFLQLFQSQ
jgi:hypothetical protein